MRALVQGVEPLLRLLTAICVKRNSDTDTDMRNRT